MFIETGRQLAPDPQDRHMPYVDPADLADLENHRATISINIPRLWRSGIREFTSSIGTQGAPKFAAIEYFL
jgi:hypothetical protein